MKLVILDGSSLLFRAFYALPTLTTSEGIYTNAVVGFSNMLVKLLKEEKPDGIVIAFDKSKDTFRRKKYAEYKGTRKPTPDELKMQIPILKEFAETAGICFIEMDGYEADDIIGTLATKGAANDDKVIVVTGDRDALQLIRENLSVYLTKKGISEVIKYTKEVFKEEYGIQPIRLIDLKGLMGDKSDNIPGVPGVGDKTALKLLVQYGSLENVLENAQNISGKKLKENLTAYKEQAILSKELATICLDTPNLEYDKEKFVMQPDFGRLKAFCAKYELSKLWQNFQKEFKITDTSDDLSLFDDYSKTENLQNDSAKLSLDFEQADLVDDAFFNDFFKEDVIAFSLITANRTVDIDILGVMLKNSERMIYVSADSLIFSQVLDSLSKTNTLWTSDVKTLYHAGLNSLTRAEDVFLKFYLLFPEAEGKLEKFSHILAPTLSLPSKLKDSTTIAALETMLVYEFGAYAEERLKKEDLLNLYETIEKPLIKVLYEMEKEGVYFSVEQAKAESDKMAKQLSSIEDKIYSLADATFNLNSPKALSEILFEKLSYPKGKKTKTGYSTDTTVLLSLKSDERPIIDEIISYRALSKLKSTYLDAIPLLVSPKTKKVHTTFNQKITATGRLSSSDPNLQNIPVRTEEGRAIRSLFLPKDDYELLLSADYSQIELRILAHLTKDENMIAAFLRNEDIHTATAAEVFGKSIEEVTSEMRAAAKAVNFGIVYGITDFGLAQNIGITRAEAKGYIEKYFTKFAKIKNFIDETITEARELLYVKTLYGRKRHLPDIKNHNFNIRSASERIAVNTRVQGTAADIIKLAMIRVSEALKTKNMKSKILLQVHDELVLETTNDEVQAVTELVKDIMETVVKLDVPLIADVHSAKNWGSLK